MFATKNLLRSCIKPNSSLFVKFCTCNILNEKQKNKFGNQLGDMGSKYKFFQEQDSEMILDVYEERLKYSNLLEEEDLQRSCSQLNHKRGKSGVFEIEDLVKVLKWENSENIFVAKLPNEMKYVDYICIVTGKSQRHMQAIAQFIRRSYKQRRNQEDIVPKLEGESSKDWMALDLGNIALHIFSTQARKLYDLDSLWTVGTRFDDEFNKKDLISDMLGKHSIYLEGLEPAS